MTKEQGLAGHYFLNTDEHGLRGFGKILSRVEPGWYLVEDQGIISSRIILVRIEDMQDWIFYEDKEAWTIEVHQLDESRTA